MKDTIESLVSDVKIYSNGLINALQNKRQSEALDYVQKMKRCLKTIDEYLEMKKDMK